MIRKVFVFFFACLVFLSCQQPNQQNNREQDQPKGSLFIIGGGHRSLELMDRLSQEAGIYEGGDIVILPMSSAVPDSAIIWSSESFLELGIEPGRIKGYNFELEKDPKEEWIEVMREAKLIYISGGDQNRFMEIVRETPIFDAIHHAYQQGALIAGTSAGAAVMSEKMITGDELRYEDYRSTFRTIESENIEIADGLGLLKTAIIDQHFVWRSRHNRLISAVIEYPHLPGIGIDESTAILVRGDSAEVVGVSQVLVYSNPEHSAHHYEHKLGAKNLKLDIYLPGEKFSIK